MAGLIGHIVNRAATGGDRRVEAAPAVILRAPESFSQLDECLAEMRAEGVETLVIDGGDGTVREVISRAPEIWGGAPIRYAIAPNGNTNLIARHAGGVPPGRVAALAEPGGGERATRLPVMKVERAGEQALRGFILGAGAYETATRFAQEEIGARHARQVMETVMKVLRSAELRAPTAMGLARDGGEMVEEARLAAAFTTFTKPLILGLNPFATAEAGPIRMIDIAANPPRLVLAAGFLAAGKPRKWMRGHYRVGACETASLRLSTGFVMDGERFEPGADGLLRLSAAETATFLSL
ncbi:MAG: diacylglycerol kinase family protein [Pseudomonadota bacterium]